MPLEEVNAASKHESCRRECSPRLPRVNRGSMDQSILLHYKFMDKKIRKKNLKYQWSLV